MEVTSEVQVDILHRDDLRVPAASRATLHPEDRPEARLTETEDDILLTKPKRVGQPRRDRRLPLTRWSRCDTRHQDELTILPLTSLLDRVERDLGLVGSIRRYL